MPETLAIKTENLVKFYGNFQALFGVNLEVKKGEIFGFLGPNGAGKTTTIRCLMNLIHPNSGLTQVFGIDPQKDPVAVRTRIGYLPGELNLDPNLTGEAVLGYFSALRGLKPDWRLINQWADRLSLDLKRQIKNLSHGNKQKVGILQALVHQPDLLLLDEPTTGLDPINQQEVLRIIKEAKNQGKTIFFSSHIINEVEAVTDRVAIIRKGQIIEVADTKSLVKRSIRRAQIRFKQEVDITPILQLEGVTLLKKDDSTGILIQIAGEIDPLVKALAKYSLIDFDTERPSLEEVFLAYYQDGKGDG